MEMENLINHDLFKFEYFRHYPSENYRLVMCSFTCVYYLIENPMTTFNLSGYKTGTISTIHGNRKFKNGIIAPNS